MLFVVAVLWKISLYSCSLCHDPLEGLFGVQIRDIAKSTHINRTIFDCWYQNFSVNHLNVSKLPVAEPRQALSQNEHMSVS